MPVVVIKVMVSLSKTPAVTTMVLNISVAARGLSYVTLGKITATHVRSIRHAMWSVSPHRVGSSADMRSTAASNVCATTATEVGTAAPSASAPSAPVGDKGQIALVARSRWKAS